ncbi:MAG: T9SS C-terminal target domain-containing protein [Calditrichaeota bacterium]|nr:MAG: T9SS C-terminal target domain-containing protein [Calditrichota bacterium]
MTLLRKMSVTAMVAMLIFAFTVPAISQVNVTFRVNTSTNNDTLHAGHFVQMRGQHTGTFPDGKNITWGDDSDLVLTNVGGDYWELTIQMNPQDTLYYKYWAGFDATSGTGGSGWEGAFVKGPLGWDTRTYIAGNSDDVLDMAYFHDDAGEVMQSWRPFEVKADTVAVWFRVNMAGLTKKQQFDPAANGPLTVRGDNTTSGGVLTWGDDTNVILSREGDGDFWSGAAYMPKADLTAGNVQQYKFFIVNKHADGPDWESVDNRTFTFSDALINTTMDTTLAWNWFNNEPPSFEDPVPGNVIFRVAVDALEKTGLFSRTVGDSIIIKGPKGWDDADAIRMDYNPVLNEYTANVSFNLVVGSTVYYKYFVKWDPSRVDPMSPNYLGYQFQEADDLGTGWEEPAVNGGADRTFVFEGVGAQLLPGDFGFQNQYFNSLLPTGVTTDPVTVTFNINMMPATDTSTNPDLAPFRVGMDTAWIKIDTPLFRQTQQVDSDTLRYMLTDSDGDGVYSATTTLMSPTFISVPYSIVYTSEDGEIDNASGYSLGRRYYQFIHPVSINQDLEPTYPSSFNFPTVDWKLPGECVVETAPDLLTPFEPQPVNVTFRVNTSTNNDTLHAGHFVQMRGQHTGTFPDGKNITWGDDSDLVLTNVGGDYWELTIQMNPQDTLYYKYWAGFDATSGTGGSGWEGAFVKGPLGWDTRTYIAGNSDDVLDMAYFHDDAGEVMQSWRPFEVKADTVAVWFRVNMAGLTKKQQFDPAANGPLTVRGDNTTSGGVLTWGDDTNVILSREGDGDFWSGAAYMPKADLTAGNVQQYKFFIVNKHADGPDWESVDNRTFTFSDALINTTMDTTLAWNWFNNEPPSFEDPVPGNVIFRVAVDALEKTGLFSRTVGDSIIIKGPKGWDDADAIRMDYNPVLNEYTANVSFNLVVGSTVYYKYFVKWDPSRVDPMSPNYLGYQFQEADDLGTGWEEPAVNGGADRTFVFEGVGAQLLPGDFGFQNQYFNSLLPTGVTTDPVTVTFNINMMPATDTSTNPDLAPFRVGMDTAWIKIDTPLFRQTQQVDSDTLRYMLTDSDGDGVYSATTTLMSPTFISVPYSIVYTSEDGEIDNASGYSLGRRYYQFIHPTTIDNDLVPTYPSEFNFPTVDWKLPGECVVETAPDLLTPLAVAEREEDLLPTEFGLEQNYPNPFNPETTLKYSLAKTADVQINVYNSIGQLVQVLVNQRQEQGAYRITWTGTDFYGRIAPSGIYFVKMVAGDFHAVKKMTLLK